MFTFILLIITGVLFIWWLKCGYMNYQKMNFLFNVEDTLDFETAILFSNEELARRILKIVKRTNKPLTVRIADNYSFIVPADISKTEILAKLDDAQSLMIHKRYNGKDEILVKDYLDRMLFDIWLDYGYKYKYRTILKREMDYLLEKGELSNSSYNEIYRRAFYFERNKLCDWKE